MTAASTTAERLRAFLGGSTFLGSLPGDALDALVRRGHARTFAKGETLYERGDAGDWLVIIVSGSVKIWNTTLDAREVVLNFLKAGDVNGEIAVLDGGVRTATATTLEKTEAVVIHRRDLQPVLMANPAALMEIIAILCEKLRLASEIVEDGQRDMPGRAATGLLRLARQHGRTSKDGIVIDLKVSQRDLGNYLGLSRENTNRQLASLRDAGLIRLDGTRVIILDETKLTALAALDGS